MSKKNQIAKKFPKKRKNKAKTGRKKSKTIIKSRKTTIKSKKREKTKIKKFYLIINLFNWRLANFSIFFYAF